MPSFDDESIQRKSRTQGLFLPSNIFISKQFNICYITHCQRFSFLEILFFEFITSLIR
jgi:hypothetical protein